MPTLSTPSNVPEQGLRAEAYQQFLDRPTLSEVTLDLLDSNLERAFAGLQLRARELLLAEPISAPRAGWQTTPLLDVALEVLANPRELVLDDVQGLQAFLTRAMPHPVKDGQTRLSHDKIAEVIRSVPEHIGRAFQSALLGYWKASSSLGISRIQWLSGLLMQAMANARGAAGVHAGMLEQLLAWPQTVARKAARGDLAVTAWMLETRLGAQGQEYRVVSADLVLVSAEAVLRCSPAGTVVHYPSVQVLIQAWTCELERRHELTSVACTLYEVQGSAFATQAEFMLERQLQDVADVALRTGAGVPALAEAFVRATDCAALFDAEAAQPQPALQRLQNALPAWLAGATMADRFAYRRHLAALAGVQLRAAGQGFLDGITDLRTYAATQLRTAMLKDHPQGPGYSPDELLLNFAVPYGNAGGWGFVEHTEMSLLDLALNNLSSQPKGSMTVSHRQGQPVPAWMTADYVRGLVRQVDIGQHYVALIERTLRSDVDEAARRQKLYAEQLRVQLPMQALELKLKAQAGFTDAHYQCVAAVLSERGSSRWRIYPLGLLSGQGAAIDPVLNMFVFGPARLGHGPVVLYRPFAAQPLLAYENADALLQAMSAEGTLQLSVLAWLADAARPVYANGGFETPHLGIAVDDPGWLPSSEPASLAEQPLGGDVLATLYQANVEALIQLADQQSVSNREDRWRMFKEAGWLIFNTVLPLLEGPLAVAGWVLQLVSSLDADLQRVHDADPQVRASAVVDLLFNLAALLGHVAGGVRVAARPVDPALLQGQPRLRAPASVRPALVLEASLETPAGAAGNLAALPSALEMNVTGMRSRVAPALLAFLHSFKVQAPASWPPAIESGARRGLFLLDDTLHVMITPYVFRVAEQDEGFCIVDALDPHRKGPWLRVDAAGNWDLDLTLRLRGGGPRAQRMTQERALEQYTRARIRTQKARTKVDDAWGMLAPLLEAYDVKYLDAARLLRRYDAEGGRLLKALLAAREEARTFRQALQGPYTVFRAAQKALFEQQAADRRHYETLNQIGISAEQTRGEFLADYATCYRKLILDHLRMEGLLMEAFRKTSLNDHYLKAMHGIEVPVRAQPDPDLQAASVAAVVDLFEALEHAETADTLLDERNKPGFSPYAELIAQGAAAFRRDRRIPSAAQIRARYLNVLSDVIVTEMFADAQERAHYLQRIGGSGLNSVMLSHAGLSAPEASFTVTEQVQLLDTALKSYSDARDTAEYLHQRGAQGNQHLADYIRTLARLQDATQQQLARLITDDAADTLFTAQPPDSVNQAQRRVIKTRNRKTLVGTAREPSAAEPLPIVDIVDPLNDGVVVSYREHADEGVWVEIHTPRPVAPRSQGVLSKLKGQTRALLGKVQATRARQQENSQRPYDPWEVEYPLSALAEELEQVAQRIESHPAAARDEPLIVQARTQAAELKALGTTLRIDMCKKQLPTAANLRYLYQQREVNIARIGNRVATAAGDFFHEYTIRDTQGALLFYAHFHYPALDTPAAQFSVAHLKTVAQRKLTYRQQVKRAASAREIIQVWYGVISRHDAQEWFPVGP